MKKKIYGALLFTLSFCGLNAQTAKHAKIAVDADKRVCGTMDHHEYLLKTRLGYKEDIDSYRKRINDFLALHPSGKTGEERSTINIPVVFHVVYNTAAENISDTRVLSQLDVLNADFNKTNADTANIPALFKSRAAGLGGVNFCAAQVDPNGVPTNGIVRVQTSKTSFGTNDAVKFTAQGGSDAWDVTKYVNIWICDIGGGILGYAEFPSNTISNTWGLVLQYSSTGVGGSAPYNLGRTGTHEFGHCFGLYHIWGDESQCAQDDGIADTPQQKAENYGCPSFPQGTSSTTGCCNAADQSSMYMNYMDYTDDACMNMFSQGQVAEMLAIINNPPYNVLKNSTACNPPLLTNNDIALISVNDPGQSVCSNIISPKVTIKNFGSNPLVSANINYQLDGGALVTYSWMGSLAQYANESVTLSPVSVNSGNHTLLFSTNTPNGVADENTTNDSLSVSFSVNTGGLSLPLFEGFEGAFPPTGWTLENPDNSKTWSKTAQAKYNGTASAYVDNANYNANNQKDRMVLPQLDLTSLPNPTLSFYVSYKLWTNPAANPNFSDTLDITISTDCGLSWTTVYRKAGTALVTNTPTFQGSDYFPTQQSQWRLETVDLTPFASSNTAIIKIENTTAYENNLFIDDLSVDNIVSTKEIIAKNLSITIFPNPAKDLIYVNTNSGNNINEVRLYNVLGELINTYSGNFNSYTEIKTLDLKNGVYFVQIETENGSAVKRLIIEQ